MPISYTKKVFPHCQSNDEEIWKMQTKEASEYTNAIPGLGEMDRYTTFYLKIAMFWLCEEAPPSFWEESGLHFCIKTFLKKMDNYFKDQNLPDFFAPQ